MSGCHKAITALPPRAHSVPRGLLSVWHLPYLWLLGPVDAIFCVAPGVTTLLPCPQSAPPRAAVGSKHALKVEAVEGHLKLILLPGSVPLWRQHFRHLLEPSCFLQTAAVVSHSLARSVVCRSFGIGFVLHGLRLSDIVFPGNTATEGFILPSKASSGVMG